MKKNFIIVILVFMLGLNCTEMTNAKKPEYFNIEIYEEKPGAECDNAYLILKPHLKMYDLYIEKLGLSMIGRYHIMNDTLYLEKSQSWIIDMIYAGDKRFEQYFITNEDPQTKYLIRGDSLIQIYPEQTYLEPTDSEHIFIRRKIKGTKVSKKTDLTKPPMRGA